MQIAPHQSLRLTTIFSMIAAVATVFALSLPKPAGASLELNEANQPRKVAAGSNFLCMEANSAVVCSGNNSDGQLGDGTTTARNYLKGLTAADKIMNPKAIVAGSRHACAIAGTSSAAPGDGTLYCWGDNQYGQLGNGTTTDSSAPVQVSDNGSFTNSGVIGVIAGDNHTCAIKTVSSVNRIFCWGLNDYGQVGDGTTTNRSTPTALAGVFATAAVWSSANSYPQAAAGASHTCASNATVNPNKIYCWGRNTNGQLGDGSTTSSSTPVNTGLDGQPGSAYAGSFIAAGLDFTCHVLSATIRCWGGNSKGQMGNGGGGNVLTPTRVPNNGSFDSASGGFIAAGGQTVCATTQAIMATPQYLWCWGANTAGQVGDGTSTDRNVPVLVANNSATAFSNGTLGTTSGSGSGNTPTGITVGRSVTDGFACVTYWCWGKNADGQLAQGNTNDASLAAKVKVGSVVADEVTGATVTAEMTANGVKVTFAGVPASAVTNAQVTVAPASYDLFGNPSMSAGSVSYSSKFFSGSNLPVVANGGFTLTVPTLSKMVMNASGPPTSTSEQFAAGTSYHLRYTITGPAATGYADGWKITRASSAGGLAVTDGASATTTTTAPATTASPGTTAAPTTTVATTTNVANVFAAAKPGVTVTDTKVYTKPPVEVAASSAINVLTPAQAKVMDIETKTPAICLPNDDELVFIDEGKCIAEVVNAKTRAVLRTLKTTVVADDISEVKVGNAIVTLAPIYFDAMSATLDARDLALLRSIKSKVSAAGSVLVIGHSGTLNGNSPANVAISRDRAIATVAALKSIGAKGPFALSGVGALDPASKGKTEAAQAKNRRVVIALIP